MSTFAPKNNAATKRLGRFVSAKKFWTPERLAAARRRAKADPPARREEFIEIMRRVEGF